MKAYVELIQRKERELGTDILTHQKVRVYCSSVLEEYGEGLIIAHSGAAQTTSTT
jgi:isocitrate lyase